MMKEQFIKINKHGDKIYFKDSKMTILHREDGPAVEYADGGKEWFIDNELHRDDGPAVELANGAKQWLINGKCHREDGPAIEWADGFKEWFIDGEELTEEEFNARMSGVELTLEEIAERFNVSADQLKIKK